MAKSGNTLHFKLPSRVEQQVKDRVRDIYLERIAKKEEDKVPKITREGIVLKEVNRFLMQEYDRDRLPKYIVAEIPELQLSPEKIKEIFTKRGVSKLAYFDVMYMFIKNNVNASFLVDENITTVQELALYLHQKPEYQERLKKVKSFKVLYSKYDSITDTLKNRIKTIDESHVFDPDAPKEDYSTPSWIDKIKRTVSNFYWTNNSKHYNTKIENKTLNISNNHNSYTVNQTKHVNSDIILQKKGSLKKSLGWFFLAILTVGIFSVCYLLYNPFKVSEYPCYKNQISPEAVENKTAGLRIVILPLKKGNEEVQEPFECILLNKMKHLVNIKSSIDPQTVTKQNIEVLLGNDLEMDWEGYIHNPDVIDSIAKTYKADYIIWGRYVREHQLKINKATFEIIGRWTGGRINAQEVVEHPNNWSAELQPSSQYLIESALKKDVSIYRNNELANFYTIENIHSKEVEYDFMSILAHYFYKRKEYEKSYECLREIYTTNAFFIQGYCANRDGALQSRFLKKMKTYLDSKGFSADSYELMNLAHSYYSYAFHNSRNKEMKSKKKDENWKKLLIRANAFADSSLKYFEQYEAQNTQNYNPIIVGNIRKQRVSQIQDSSNFYLTKGHYQLLIENDVESACRNYFKQVKIRDALPRSYRRKYSDIDMIIFLYSKGYFFEAEQLIYLLLQENHAVNKDGFFYADIEAKRLKVKKLFYESDSLYLTDTTKKRLNYEAQIIRMWHAMLHIEIYDYLNNSPNDFDNVLKKANKDSIHLVAIIITLVMAQNQALVNMTALQQLIPLKVFDFVDDQKNRYKVFHRMLALQEKRVSYLQQQEISITEYIKNMGIPIYNN